MIVTLSEYELLTATMCAQVRHLSAIFRNQKDRHGMKHDSYQSHVMGACGEMAAAKALGISWEPTVDTYRSRGDIGKYEVKTRSANGYEELFIRDDDREAPFILVIDKSPEFDVIGWFHSAEAKKHQEWKKTYGNREPSYFVPNQELKPLEELMAYEKPANELGTLWRNETASGKVNWKGTIDGVGAVVCWENETKSGKRVLRVMRDDRPPQRQESVPSYDEVSGAPF